MTLNSTQIFAIPTNYYNSGSGNLSLTQQQCDDACTPKEGRKRPCNHAVILLLESACQQYLHGHQRKRLCKHKDLCITRSMMHLCTKQQPSKNLLNRYVNSSIKLSTAQQHTCPVALLHIRIVSASLATYCFATLSTIQLCSSFVKLGLFQVGWHTLRTWYMHVFFAMNCHDQLFLESIPYVHIRADLCNMHASSTLSTFIIMHVLNHRHDDTIDTHKTLPSLPVHLKA